MAFTKANPKQARLKVGIYGPPGAGKTFTALLFAEGLARASGKRVAYVDTERGTDFYAKEVPSRIVHPEAFDFDAIYTSSLGEVLAEVRAIDENVYGVVIIDSISHLWDSAIAAYNGKKTKADTIPIQAWGAIKRPYKDLVRHLLDSRMHVFILGRQKNVMETGSDGEMRKVGVGMRAEGETEYEPHICLRMESSKGSGKTAGSVYAHVEKDRTGVLSGKIIPAPSFSTIEPLLALLGDEQAQSEDPDEVAARDATLLERESGERDKAREEKSGAAYTALCVELGAATTLDALGAIAKSIAKQKKTMMEHHLNALRVLYEERRKTIAGATAPEGV